MTIDKVIQEALAEGMKPSAIKDMVDEAVQHMKGTLAVEKASKKVKALCVELAKDAGEPFLNEETTLNMLLAMLWSSKTAHFDQWGKVRNAIVTAMEANNVEQHDAARYG